MNPAVQAKELTRWFGTTCALDGLSMEVQPQAILALLGPNGAGKTTFLRLLQGQIQPTAGEAFVLGVPAREQINREPWQVASMGEEQFPPDWATAEDLMRLQAEASPGFDGAWARDFFTRRDLQVGKSFGSLSKGQRRWLLAGLALASGASLLLLDEPADGLDPAARRDLFDAIRERANNRGATVVVATHVISDIERVADEAAILKKGRLLLHESLEDLREGVREIELPADAPVPSDPDWTVLSTRQQDDAQILCVRARALVDLEIRLGPQARVRRVGLEALYLALAEAETPAKPGGCAESSARSVEVAP